MRLKILLVMLSIFLGVAWGCHQDCIHALRRLAVRYQFFLPPCSCGCVDKCTVASGKLLGLTEDEVTVHLGTSTGRAHLNSWKPKAKKSDPDYMVLFRPRKDSPEIEVYFLGDRSVMVR